MENAAEERFWEIVDSGEFSLFVTRGGKGGSPRSRPMTLLAYEDTGVLWYATSASSRKVEEIGEDARVTACFLDLEGGAYAQVFGRAEVVTDPATKEEFWEDDWAEFWSGHSDPDFVLLKVIGEQAEYHLVDEDELWVIDF